MALTGQQIVNFQYGTTVITFILVALRLYVQIRRPTYPTTPPLRTRIVLEALVIFAWIVYLFEAISDTVVHNLGGFDGESSIIIPGKTYSYNYRRAKLKKMWYGDIMVYLFPMYAVKTHFCLFYHAVLIPRDTAMKKIRWCLNFTTVFVLGNWLLSTLLAAFTCWPISRNWATDETYCSSMNTSWSFGLYFGGHIATDIMVYFLPIPVLLQLKNITTRQKVYVYLTFGCGFICFAFAVTQMASNVSTVFTVADCYMLMIMERTWAILTACVPACKLLVRNGLRKKKRVDPESVVSERLGRSKEDTGDGSTDVRTMATTSTACEKGVLDADSKEAEPSREEP